MKKKDYRESMRTLNFKEILCVRGGSSWPIMNLLSFLQNISVGEDLTIGNFIPEKQ